MNEPLTEQFLKERKYLHNVSAKTLITYQCAFNAFKGCDARETIVQRISELRQRISAISVNTYLRHMRAYWKWAGVDIVIPKQKEEQKIISTLSVEGIHKLLSYKPSGRCGNLRRAHTVALLILDTGLRISEVLGLTKEDVDLDNLVIKVVGKGNKHRLVPFSNEFRKTLYRYYRENTKYLVGNKFIFSTKNNTKLTVRNFNRDFKILGKKLGIPVRGPHMLRHTFAVIYLRNGGNLEFLRRILGHSSLITTQKYLKSLGVEDLGMVHSHLSPLARQNVACRL